jgi:hypothetical protein
MLSYKEYQDYLRDNPKGYWFKAKLYGWGWTPARWQGWLVIAIYLVLIFAVSSQVEEQASNASIFINFLLPITLLTTSLLMICYATGEKPGWRWGNKK